MKGVSIVRPLLLTLAITYVPAAAADQHEQHLGRAPSSEPAIVHFVNSCQQVVEKDFDRAIALLHSFWFSAAINAFNGVLSKDPSCAMAYWGIAMSRWGNPFGGFRSAVALNDGGAAIERAKAVAPPTTREREYIAAVELLYKDAATIEQRTRIVAYEKAMEQLASQHSDDPEAQIFYAWRSVRRPSQQTRRMRIS